MTTAFVGGLESMGYPEAIVWVAVIVGASVVGYAFCKYVLGDG